MSKITVYYKGEPARLDHIMKVCRVFKERNLQIDKTNIKDEHDNESGLRKIVYDFPKNFYLPSDLDLEEMSNEMVSNCNLNIRTIKCFENSRVKYQVTVRNKE